MNRWLQLAGFCMLAISTQAIGSAELARLDNLPPGEQYRQLSLILLISGGVEPALLDAFAPQNAENDGRSASDFNPDDYKTPLLRIVDVADLAVGRLRRKRCFGDEHVDSLKQVGALVTHHEHGLLALSRRQVVVIDQDHVVAVRRDDAAVESEILRLGDGV